MFEFPTAVNDEPNLPAGQGRHLLGVRVYGQVTQRDMGILADSLRFTVPVRIAELWAEMRRITDSQRHARISRCATTVGTMGDTLQWPSKNQVVAFSALSDGLAMSAFEPGGVTWEALDLHWCVAPHNGCPRATPAPDAEMRAA